MIFGAFTAMALQAGAAPAAGPNMLGALLPFVLVFVIFYLLIIMPQRKKQKKGRLRRWSGPPPSQSSEPRWRMDSVPGPRSPQS